MLAAAQQLGARAIDGVNALQSVLTVAQGIDNVQRLQAVNEFFNRRIEFRDDIEVWGQVDYWASPLESLARGQGLSEA